METPFGFIVIDKPAGLTSHDCVNRLRKVFGIRKIGHGGTLDPSVTGVLPIAIGNATRLIPYLQGSKSYVGIIQLGTKTNTDDMQGEVIETKNWPLINKLNLNNILETFRGDILQKPPIFSSVHIKGERAYKKARRGEKFDLTPKKITINKLNILSWSQKSGELEVNIDCSKGTYIRSLARDVGDKIGCGAYLKKLHRTKSYSFTDNDSILLPEKSEYYPETIKPKILKPNKFLEHLPILKLVSDEELFRWRSGRNIDLKNNYEQLHSPRAVQQNHAMSDNESVLVLGKKHEIIGIAVLIDSLIIKPKVVFNAIG